MNKSDLAQAVADRLGLNKSQAEAAVEAMTDIITETIAGGGSVTLAGFGEFSARVRKGRVGVNPQDPSKAIDIPAVPVPKFKAGSRLKKSVKEGALAGSAPGATSAPSAPTPPPTPPPAAHMPPPASEFPDPPAAPPTPPTSF